MNNTADRHRFCDMSASTQTPTIATDTSPRVRHDSGLLDGLFPPPSRGRLPPPVTASRTRS